MATSGRTTAGWLEAAIERVVIGSRWLQVPLYIGLIFVLAVVVVKFPFKIWELVRRAIYAEEADLVLAVLSLVDLIMVANLVVMVIISGYENFVSRVDIDTVHERLAWFGKLDAGTLKIKLATSIVAISSIHLLQRFLEANSVSNDKLYVLIAMHLTFVVSALMLGVLDRTMAAKKAGEGH